MIVEQLIFITAAFALFVYMFYEFIRKNDTKYVPILAIEALRNSNRIYTFIFFKRRNKFCCKNDYIFVINNNSNSSNSIRKD